MRNIVPGSRNFIRDQEKMMKHADRSKEQIVVFAHTSSDIWKKQEIFGNFLDTAENLEYTQSKEKEGFNCKLLTFE